MTAIVSSNPASRQATALGAVLAKRLLNLVNRRRAFGRSAAWNTRLAAAATLARIFAPHTLDVAHSMHRTVLPGRAVKVLADGFLQAAGQPVLPAQEVVQQLLREYRAAIASLLRLIHVFDDVNLPTRSGGCLPSNLQQFTDSICRHRHLRLELRTVLLALCSQGADQPWLIQLSEKPEPPQCRQCAK